MYDGKLRRRITRQYIWNGAWQLTKEVHYVYAGNVVVQERDQNNLPQVSYTRGNDLSGTLEGAGGIGGLLARTDNSKLNLSDPFATTVYHADGNGNVTALIYTNATMAAKYLYDPYGNTLAESGPLAEANAYRFSSKEWDANAGLYYYLYRFYDPNLQRWPNRDPLGELGFEVVHNEKLRITWSFLQPAERYEGPNLFRFARNHPVTGIDPFGLSYGNPISGPNGPVGPSDPYAPGGAYYCPPPDPCKGPPGGVAGPQDNICSIPGGGILSGIEGDTGITKCCHQHDDCYKANGCNQNSWLPGCGSPACKQCNKNVVHCIVNILFPYGPIIAL